MRPYLYGAMSNHVHPLVETPMANLGAFLQRRQTAYTVSGNLRPRRARTRAVVVPVPVLGPLTSDV